MIYCLSAHGCDSALCLFGEHRLLGMALEQAGKSVMPPEHGDRPKTIPELQREIHMLTEQLARLKSAAHTPWCDSVGTPQLPPSVERHIAASPHMRQQAMQAYPRHLPLGRPVRGMLGRWRQRRTSHRESQSYDVVPAGKRSQRVPETRSSLRPAPSLSSSRTTPRQSSSHVASGGSPSISSGEPVFSSPAISPLSASEQVRTSSVSIDVPSDSSRSVRITVLDPEKGAVPILYEPIGERKFWMSHDALNAEKYGVRFERRVNPRSGGTHSVDAIFTKPGTYMVNGKTYVCDQDGKMSERTVTLSDAIRNARYMGPLYHPMQGEPVELHIISREPGSTAESNLRVQGMTIGELRTSEDGKYSAYKNDDGRLHLVAHQPGQLEIVGRFKANNRQASLGRYNISPTDIVPKPGMERAESSAPASQQSPSPQEAPAPPLSVPDTPLGPNSALQESSETVQNIPKRLMVLADVGQTKKYTANLMRAALRTAAEERREEFVFLPYTSLAGNTERARSTYRHTPGTYEDRDPNNPRDETVSQSVIRGIESRISPDRGKWPNRFQLWPEVVVNELQQEGHTFDGKEPMQISVVTAMKADFSSDADEFAIYKQNVQQCLTRCKETGAKLTLTIIDDGSHTFTDFQPIINHLKEAGVTFQIFKVDPSNEQNAKLLDTAILRSYIEGQEAKKDDPRSANSTDANEAPAQTSVIPRTVVHIPDAIKNAKNLGELFSAFSETERQAFMNAYDDVRSYFYGLPVLDPRTGTPDDFYRYSPSVQAINAHPILFYQTVLRLHGMIGHEEWRADSEYSFRASLKESGGTVSLLFDKDQKSFDCSSETFETDVFRHCKETGHNFLKNFPPDNRLFIETEALFRRHSMIHICDYQEWRRLSPQTQKNLYEFLTKTWLGIISSKYKATNYRSGVGIDMLWIAQKDKDGDAMLCDDTKITIQQGCITKRKFQSKQFRKELEMYCERLYGTKSTN